MELKSQYLDAELLKEFDKTVKHDRKVFASYDRDDLIL